MVEIKPEILYNRDMFIAGSPMLLYVITFKCAVSIYIEKGFGEMKRSFCRKSVQIVICLTILILLCVPSQPARAAAKAEKPVLVGLVYGSGAAPGGNLVNEVGAGYRYGCLDGERNFISLGYTPETNVSVVKTENVYYGGPLSNGYKGYSDQISSSIAVGCYHVLLNGSYGSFEEAAAAAAQIPNAFPAWINGVYQVRVGAYLDSASAAAALASLGVEGASVVGTSAYGVTVVKTGTSTVLFQFDGEKEHALTLMPGVDDSVQTQTWFLGKKYFGGFQFQRVTGGNLTIASVITLTDYISCVISQEMADGWPLEALKAQAVAARCYYDTNLGRHSAQKIDICGTTHCQAYYGCGGAGESTNRAARETAGEYIKYNGKVIEAFYYSSNGGASENSENVFVTALPYCKGKADPYEADIAGSIPNYNWTRTFTGEQLRAKLSAAGYTRCGTVKSVTITKTPAGNVYSMTFLDVNGKSWTISKDNCRIILGMNSLHFDFDGASTGTPTQTTPSSTALYAIDGDGKVSQITGSYYVLGEDGTVIQAGTAGESSEPEPTVPSGSGGTVTPADGVFRFRGAGLGHNVGMSQWGAWAMAKRGLTYRDILTFYYTGVTIES